MTYEEVKAIYDAYYGKEQFVRVLDKDVCPETKWVEGSNYVDVNFKLDPRTNRVIMMGAMDNLVKGAAGQAVQKMNLMFSTGDTEDIVWDAWKHASGGPKKLLDEGLIVSLNPYIEKYAPNLKKLLQETPGLLEQISTDDGRIFMFPTIRLVPITRANSGFAIR